MPVYIEVKHKIIPLAQGVSNRAKRRPRFQDLTEISQDLTQISLKILQELLVLQK